MHTYIFAYLYMHINISNNLLMHYLENINFYRFFLNLFIIWQKIYVVKNKI